MCELNEGFVLRPKFYFLLLQSQFKPQRLETRELPAGKCCRNFFSGIVRRGGFWQWDLVKTSGLMSNTQTSKTDQHRTVTVDKELAELQEVTPLAFALWIGMLYLEPGQFIKLITYL